jgi:hypothetical protein
MAGRVAYYGGIVKDGLVLDLDAAKKDSYPTTGTTWSDISGNSYTGSLTNGPTFNSLNGGSIVFDGTNDYVDCGNILNLAFNNATIFAWIKTTANQDYAAIAGKPWFGSKAGRYSIHTRTGGALGIIIQGSGNVEATSTTGLINTGNWVHVVGVINRSTGVTAYVNSIQVATTAGDTSATNFSTTDSFTVGYYSNNGSGYFNGNISQVQFYNRALSAAEVLQNYNASKGRYGL